MRVIEVCPSVREGASGPSESVPGLCKGLVNAGLDVELHVIGGRENWVPGYPVVQYLMRKFPVQSMARSPEMLKGLKRACQGADVIHSHSLWMMPNVYPDWARRGTRCKLVNQPRGALSKWALANSRWKKIIFGYFFQYAVMRRTDMWVATAESEYEEIRALGYRQPVCILPNGISVPDVKVSGFSGKRRRMFFISRIHPKKNLEMLIRCWSRLEERFDDWDLSIVGPDWNNAYADQMKSLCESLSCKRVTFEGELKGPAKYDFIANSECMVLPTHSENFGMVVAEALACGIPVVCSHGAPWKGLNENRCGWWTSTEMGTFEQSMREAMSCSRQELQEMGLRGKEWMRRDFSWEGIGIKMKKAYEWLVDPMITPKPEWVKVG